MIQKLFNRLLREVKVGAAWFILANILPPMIAVIMGPIILKKAGLEQFGMLGLASYFLGLIVIYADFGTYPHLMAVFHRRDPGRFSDLGSSLIIKMALILLGLLIFAGNGIYKPRADGFNAILGASLLGLLLPGVLLEWYFITRREYFHLFISRAATSLIQTTLSFAWFFSPSSNVVWVALFGSFAGVAGFFTMLAIIGKSRVSLGIKSIRDSSFRKIRLLAVKLLPIAASQFLAPYFITYSLPWFSHCTEDKKIVGAFSISYRIIIGLLTIVAPFVLYALPKSSGDQKPLSVLKMVVISSFATLVFFFLGIGLIWFYFRLSNVDPVYFKYSIQVFSILLAGIFAVCMRTPYVGQCIVAKRYKTYFMLHSVCLPVLAFSWLPNRFNTSEFVPFLACLPDILATLGFVIVFSRLAKPPQGGLAAAR